MKHVKNNNYEKKNFFNSNLFLILAISFSVLVIAGTVTYAFYQSSIKGSASGTIARWDFKANNQVATFKLDFGEIYPGKEAGPYNIVLSAANSDLDVYYELIVENIPATSYGSRFLRWENTDRGIFYLANNDGLYGRVDGIVFIGRYGTITKGKTVTIPIYFNWPYNDGDDVYTGEEIKFPTFKIIARQYTGSSPGYPMFLLNLTHFSRPGSIGTSNGDTIVGDNEQYGYDKCLIFKYTGVYIQPAGRNC